jgi:hypothetical protein
MKRTLELVYFVCFVSFVMFIILFAAISNKNVTSNLSSETHNAKMISTPNKIALKTIQ